MQDDGKGGYRPIIMSKRIFIVDDEADTNFALLGELESGFKADSNEYPLIALGHLQ